MSRLFFKLNTSGEALLEPAGKGSTPGKYEYLKLAAGQMVDYQAISHHLLSSSCM